MGGGKGVQRHAERHTRPHVSRATHGVRGITSSIHLDNARWLALGNPTEGELMTKRIQKLFLALAALAALAVGGSAFASAQNTGNAAPAAKAAPTQAPAGGGDTDNVQSGDQSAPDPEQSPASEKSGAAEQPGSESAVADDGPGGHADEPGNAAADHQFEGQE
jgi:hypothetical protein